MSISRIFDIAQRSLGTYQSALDVTAQNIANSSNPDYSRQRADLSTEVPTQDGTFIWGNGVKLEDIQRVRDQLTDEQIRSNNAKYSDSNQRNILLSNVQNLFSEPSDLGLSNLTSAFFNSWQQLSVTPNSVSLRNNVIQAAQSLSNKIQNINDGIDQVKSNIVGQVQDKVNTLNSDIKQIQTLNQQIFNAQVSGKQPNDLLDSRDKLIDDISKLANVNVTYDSSGSAVITVGGVFVADRANYVQFAVSNTSKGLSISTSDGAATPNLSGGELYALTDVFNNKIASYQTQLNDFVNRLMTSVNSTHSSGYTTTTPPQTGINFFDNYSNGVLSINNQILQDPNKIAVSKDGTAGNGDIAVNIADLINQKDSTGTTLLDNYTSLITQVGSDTQNASNTAQSYQQLLTQLQKQKSSYSGVSVDEEMSNVLQYQRSYEASAKLLTIADQMLQTLLNIFS
ncbi:MAG: flagellar hook-associated protein FlgK [Bacteroidetes bacterium]|nr:flagellar hook-associated protein FlgK [Bacteroidota bacterium]